jgi:hypothetical protein
MEKLFGPSKDKNVQLPIRVLDLPGVQRLEDKLLLNGFPRCHLLPETERLADETSIRLFGITKNQIEIYLDDFFGTTTMKASNRNVKGNNEHLRPSTFPMKTESRC